MYDAVIEYLNDKTTYFLDPEHISKEFNDVSDNIKLASAVVAIQELVHKRPTLMESGIIKGYRDLRAAEAEYTMRLYTRASYNTDASQEEADNASKWDFNKKTILLQVSEGDPAKR